MLYSIYIKNVIISPPPAVRTWFVSFTVRPLQFISVPMLPV